MKAVRRISLFSLEQEVEIDFIFEEEVDSVPFSCVCVCEGGGRVLFLEKEWNESV